MNVKDWNIILKLRGSIYFGMTMRQRKKFHSLGYEANNVEMISMSDFLKITKKRDLIDRLVQLKRMNVRSVS